MTWAIAKTDLSFFARMTTSSLLALLRGFVLAQILAPASFGTYALLVAIGTFSSSLLSFGQIERTYKRYPRLFSDGHGVQALAESDKIARLLFGRAVVVGLATIVALSLTKQSAWIGGAACAVALAFTVAIQSAYSSIHRASGALKELGKATMTRSLLAVFLAILGVVLASWPGAVIGEITAAALGGWISRAYVKRANSRKEASRSPLRPIAAQGKELWLFIAFLMRSIPLYLDKVIVSTLFGNAVTGSYSLLTLFVMGSFTFTSIISQKLGPQLVRLQWAGASMGTQYQLLGKYSAIVSGLSVGGIFVASVALLQGPLTPLAVKYDLSPALMAATAAMCVGQVTLLLEWSLISHNRERWVFAAASSYIFILATCVCVIGLFDNADVTDFMWAMAAGKLLHLLILVLLLLRLQQSIQNEAVLDAETVT